MKPTHKSEPIEQLLTSVFGVDRRKSIRSDVCTFCKKPAVNFKDELSRREFAISGLCQECQDETFSEDQ